MGTTSSVDSRRVFAIAGPAMAASLTTPLLGVVATTAIGRTGDAALLGGVAIASIVFDCLFWLFGFLRMGTVAFTAQAQGANDSVEIRAVLIRALLLAWTIGLLLIALELPFKSLVFGLMGGSETASAAAQHYFAIRIWSAPLALGNYVILGWLIGQARTGVALMLQIAINLTSMAITALLVLGLGHGIAGAAVATVIAEATGFVAGIAVIRRAFGGLPKVDTAILFARDKIVRLFAVNRDIMIRTAALIGAFLFFTAQGARAGDTTLAANAVLNNLLLIGSFFLDGLANAAEQLCGQSIGERDRDDFAQAVRLILIWAFVFGLSITVVFVFGGAPLIDLMTTSPEVRTAARGFLLLAAVAPLCGVMAYCYDGIYIGATWTRDMRTLMVISLLIYLVAWWALQPFGNAGLWSALLVFLAARGLLQAWRYPALLRATFPAYGAALQHAENTALSG